MVKKNTAYFYPPDNQQELTQTPVHQPHPPFHDLTEADLDDYESLANALRSAPD